MVLFDNLLTLDTYPELVYLRDGRDGIVREWKPDVQRTFDTDPNSVSIF